MQGRPDGDPFADLLSGFSTPALQDGSSAKAKRDSDIFDLFGPTPPLASSGNAGPSLSSQRPAAQQVIIRIYHKQDSAVSNSQQIVMCRLFRCNMSSSLCDLRP